MNKTERTHPNPRIQHQQLQHRQRQLPRTTRVETTIGETEEKIRNVETKVEQENQSKKTLREKRTKLNVILRLITENLDQGVTFEKFQDILKNYVLKNFHKAEDIFEMVTDLNNPFPNFETKHMQKEFTKTC